MTRQCTITTTQQQTMHLQNIVKDQQIYTNKNTRQHHHKTYHTKTTPTYNMQTNQSNTHATTEQ